MVPGMRPALLLLCCAWLAAGELLPGWPQPLPPAADPPPAWRRADGRLAALAGDGSVRWSIDLAPGAQVWPGDGGALLADDRGLRWIAADRGERPLPPLPSDIVPLGVDRGAASFAQDLGGWLLPADAGAPPVRIELGAVALGPALADGRESLWLTMHHLVHNRDGLLTRHRHGLAAGRGWSLRRDADGRPQVTAPDGHRWLVPPYVPGADDERLGAAAPLPSDAPRDRRLRDALRRGDWPGAARLAIGTAEQAAVAMYARGPVPDGVDDLAPMPRDPAEALLPEEAWSGGQAPRARPHVRPAGPPAGCDRDRPLDDGAADWPEDPEAQHTGDGLVLGLRSWKVVDDGERVTATCRDDGRPRWFTRWLSEPGLGAPARFIDIRQGLLLVGEGDARLLLLDLGDGSVGLDVRLRRLPVMPGRTWAAGAGAVVLHPPGRDDHVGWIGADGSERDEILPAPARWILGLPDGEVWLALQDGRCLAARGPGSWRPIALPAGLAQARAARLVDGGVAGDGRRWPWRSTSP